MVYAAMISTPTGSTYPPVATARSRAEVWVRGSAQIMAAANPGRALTSKSVPHMNDMGRMIRPFSIMRVGVDPARSPAATPNMENIRLEIRSASMNQMLMKSPGVSSIPRSMITMPPMSPLTIPMRLFPRMTDEVCIGLSISSSKLVWNSLWMTIFWDDYENPEFIEEMATIPGMTYARYSESPERIPYPNASR